jgi:hypothetical protein
VWWQCQDDACGHMWRELVGVGSYRVAAVG